MSTDHGGFLCTVISCFINFSAPQMMVNFPFIARDGTVASEKPEPVFFLFLKSVQVERPRERQTSVGVHWDVWDAPRTKCLPSLSGLGADK